MDGKMSYTTPDGYTRRVSPEEWWNVMIRPEGKFYTEGNVLHMMCHEGPCNFVACPSCGGGQDKHDCLECRGHGYVCDTRFL